MGYVERFATGSNKRLASAVIPLCRYSPVRSRAFFEILGLSLLVAYNYLLSTCFTTLPIPGVTQKEHADAHPLPLHARRIDHPDIFPYPPKVPRKAPTRDSRLTPAWGDSLGPRQARLSRPLSPLLHTTKGAPMDLNPLQQAMTNTNDGANHADQSGDRLPRSAAEADLGARTSRKASVCNTRCTTPPTWSLT